MHHNYFKVRKAINECLERAKALYGFQFPVTINFRNTGRTAGLASRGGYISTDDYSGAEYALTFNTQMLEDNLIDHLIDDTIPHEIAHLVCYADPTLGRNHDRGWKRVCQRLGGSGSRTHNYSVTKARRTRKAIYNINGSEVEIGKTVHSKIQKGAVYHMRSCKTQIRPEYFTGKVVLK